MARAVSDARCQPDGDANGEADGEALDRRKEDTLRRFVSVVRGPCRDIPAAVPGLFLLGTSARVFLAF